MKAEIQLFLKRSFPVSFEQFRVSKSRKKTKTLLLNRNLYPLPPSKSLSKVDENPFSEKYILEIVYNTSKHNIPMISIDLETIWELVPHNFDFMVSGDSCLLLVEWCRWILAFSVCLYQALVPSSGGLTGHLSQKRSIMCLDS